MDQGDLFDSILVGLHETVLDGERWPAVSALIGEACGATGNKLITGAGDAGDVEIYNAMFWSHGRRREDWEREYFAFYHAIDERLPRLRRLPDSHIVHVSELFSEAEKKTSVVYNDVLPRFGAQNGLNVRLDGPDGSRIIWITADPIGSGGWESDRIEMIGSLLPHIRQSVTIHQTLAKAQALGASLTGLLDNTRVGVVQLNWRGRVLEANDRARDLLRSGDGLVERDGVLGARSPVDDDRLARLLARALPPFGTRSAGGSMRVQRSPGRPGLALHVVPVGRRQEARARVAALVLVVDPDSRLRIDPPLVATMLDLTAPESQVAALLSEGRSVRDIAAAMGRGEPAVRGLLRQIYKKLGISRQAELVRLVFSLVEFAGPRR